MDSVVRISFFIVLSCALHIVSLPFDFLLPAESFKSRQVGVSYVSRSLDSFYIVPKAITSTSRVVDSVADNVVQQVQKVQSEQFQPKRTNKKSFTEVKSVVSINSLKQKQVSSETPVVVASELVREKMAGEQESAKADVDEKMLFAEKIPVNEVIEQALQQAVEKGKSLAQEDLSLMQKKTLQSAHLINSPSQVPSMTVQENNNYRQEFIDALPRYNVNPPPRYPQVAKLRGWEGKVVFKALILKSGQVGRLQVLTSSGYRSLDDAARKAINRWKFKPATSFGIAIDSPVEIPVTFSLKNL